MEGHVRSFPTLYLVLGPDLDWTGLDRGLVNWTWTRA